MSNACKDQLHEESTPTNALVFFATEALEFFGKPGVALAKIIDGSTAFSGDVDENQRNTLIRVRKLNDGCSHISILPNFAFSAFPDCAKEMQKAGTHWRQYGYQFWHPYAAFEPKQPGVEWVRHEAGPTIAVQEGQRARTGQYDDIGISPAWCPQCIIQKQQELEQLRKKMGNDRT